MCVVEREQRKTRPRHSSSSSLGSQRKDEEMRPISPPPALLPSYPPPARKRGGAEEDGRKTYCSNLPHIFLCARIRQRSGEEMFLFFRRRVGMVEFPHGRLFKSKKGERRNRLPNQLCCSIWAVQVFSRFLSRIYNIRTRWSYRRRILLPRKVQESLQPKRFF